MMHNTYYSHIYIINYTQKSTQQNNAYLAAASRAVFMSE